MICHQSPWQLIPLSFSPGLKCDSCEFGFYALSADNPLGCSSCDCNPIGSTNEFCNPVTGQCSCKSRVTGRQCNQCVTGFFNFESGCVSCDCDPLGTEPGSSCTEGTGQCVCKAYVTGPRCDQCQDGYYSLGGDMLLGCLPCDCHTAGTNNMSAICDKGSGACVCKENVQGRSCNQCRPNTYNLRQDNALGCQPCDCDPSGTLQGDQLPPFELTCDQNTGNCTCLAQRVGRRCETCSPGQYGRLYGVTVTALL